MRESTPSDEVDTESASIARTYDAVIGGKDNFAVDRELAQKTLAMHPAFPELALGGRRWQIRAVGYLADRCGVDQYLDLGSGLPTVQNTHEVAQRYQPQANVVYVDNDPAVNAFENALLSETGRTGFSNADLTDPDAVLNDPAVRELDWTRPIALMQCYTLHHVDDDIDPWRLMRRYIEALPSGSYVCLSHISDPQDGGPVSETAQALQRAWRESSMGTGRFRSPEQLRRMLDGLELLEPGVVPLEAWWPSGPRTPTTADGIAIGAVGRKP